MGRFEVADLLAVETTAGRLSWLYTLEGTEQDRLLWLLDQAEERVHSDPSVADELAELAELAQRPETPPTTTAAPDGKTAPDSRTAPEVRAAQDDLVGLRARGHYLRARIKANEGELQTSIQMIAEARELWRSAGDELAALRTDLGRMAILDDLGRHDEAIAVGEQLIAGLESSAAGNEPLARRIRAHAMDNVGAAYGFTGQHVRALTAYASAERAYHELGMTEEAARPLANRAVEMLALGRPRQALEDLRQANQTFLAAGDRLFAAQCQGDMASAHRALGQFGEALALLEPARRTLAELGAQAEADRIQLALAETYLAVGLVSEARSAAEESAERTERAGLAHDHAFACYLLALSQLAGGRSGAALAELDRAERAFGQVGDRHYLARTRLARAEALAQGAGSDDSYNHADNHTRHHTDNHTDTGARAEARELAHAAVDEFEAGGWSSSLLWALLLTIDWTDDPADTEALLKRAEILVGQLRLPGLSYAYQLRSARWLRRCGRSSQAETVLRQALTELDRTSATLSDYTVRAAFRIDRFAGYDELVDLLLDRGEVEAACLVSDQAKARTLRELRSDAVGVGPDMTGEDAELAAAHTDLNASYVALHQTDDPATRRQLRLQADEQERLVSRLRLQIGAMTRVADPTEGEVPAASGPAAGLDPGSQPALAYHVIGQDVVAFVCTSEQVVARRLPGVVPVLTAQLEELGAQWSRCARGRLNPRRHELLLGSTRHSLQALYQALIRPVEDQLVALGGSFPKRDGSDGEEGDEEIEVLQIVPHGVVGSVPFAALWDGQRYLTERFALSVLPTLDDRPTERAEPGPAFRPESRAVVISVADEAIPEAVAEGELVADRLDLVQSPGHRVRRLSGEQADARTVTEAVAGAGLVHLACHGVFRAENPLFSRLRLSDRWLTTAEIVRLELPSALVTLSACESGRHGGRGEPIGLGWAFLAAGATGVLVTQWKVDDQAARELMDAYYRALTDRLEPASALRRAQLQVAAERPHPYYWAPFSYLASSTSPNPATSPRAPGWPTGSPPDYDRSDGGSR